MPVVTGNFGALLAPGLRSIWGDSYADFTEEYSKVFEIVNSVKNYEDDHSISSLGLVPEKQQGGSIKYDTMYDGRTKRYTPKTYGLGFTVSREMYEDLLYTNTIIKKIPAALARSDKYTIEILAANILNNAFSTVNLGADGKRLCATDHPLVGGGTLSNRAATDADLDITSFENALISIQTDFVDDRNHKIRAVPKKLIIHPSEQFQAQMILKSAQMPDTANNNINPVYNYNIETVVMNWLTAPAAWFLQTDVADGLIFVWRRRPDFGQSDDFDSENAKFKTTFRCDMGWTDFRALWATPGA